MRNLTRQIKEGGRESTAKCNCERENSWPTSLDAREEIVNYRADGSRFLARGYKFHRISFPGGLTFCSLFRFPKFRACIPLAGQPTGRPESRARSPEVARFAS